MRTDSVAPNGPALQIGFDGAGPASWVRQLESLPIDSLWVGGHIASPRGTAETMVSLARLAATTERVRVGSSIVILPLYPPAVVAKQAADLQEATAGRVSLGVGIGGEYPVEFRACQIPVEERGRRTDEAIAVIRRLWSGEPVSSDGPFYPMDAVTMLPPPSPMPPILVAGRKRPAMRRAALLGDGWMPYLYSARRYADSVRTITEIAGEARRSLASFEWCAYLFVNVDTTLESATRGASEYLAETYGQDMSEFVDRVAVVGASDDVGERLQAYVDAGARHLIFVPTVRGQRIDVVQQIVEEIVPRISVPAGDRSPSGRSAAAHHGDG